MIEYDFYSQNFISNSENTNLAYFTNRVYDLEVKKIVKESTFENLTSSKFKVPFSFAYFYQNNLVLFRDIFGIVPLYYLIIDNKLYASDNILDLVNQPNYKREVNSNYLIYYFNYSNPTFSYTKYTIWKNIFIVLPGQKIEFKKPDQVNSNFCFDFKKSEVDETNLIKNFKEIYSNAIVNKIPDNQNIAFSLSGGLDSSSLIARYVTLKNKIINTIKFSGHNEINTEESYAAEIIKKFKTAHKTLYQEELNGEDYLKNENKLCEINGIPSNPFSIGNRMINLLDYLKSIGANGYVMGLGGDDIMVSRGVYIDYLHQRNLNSEIKVSFKQLKNIGEEAYVLKYINSNLLKLFTEKKYVALIKYFFLTISTQNIFKLFIKIIKFKKQKVEIYNRKDLFLIELGRINFENIMNLDLKNNIETDKLDYFEEVYKVTAIKTKEHFYNISKKYEMDFIFPLYDFELVNFLSNVSYKKHFGNGLGRNLLREAMLNELPDSIRLRTNKTTFNNNFSYMYKKISEQFVKAYGEKHTIWNYANRTNFIKYTKLINEDKLDFNQELIFDLIKIIYFGVWLEIYFKSN